MNENTTRESKPASIADRLARIYTDPAYQERVRQNEASLRIPPPTAVRPCALDASWPERHVGEVDGYHGAAIDVAPRIERALDGGGTVLLCGDRGRGKTGLAVWIATRRVRAGKPGGTYLRALDLFALIKRAWDRGAGTEGEWATIERFRKAPLLVIDELQDRSESDWEQRTLTNIIDHRYAAGLPTLLISNLSPSEFGLALGTSIMDRAAETGGVVVAGWPSYRA